MFPLRSASFAILLLAFLATLAVPGCGKKKSFTEDDFKKLTKGMTPKEVEAVLGTPDRTENRGGTMTVSFWKRGKTEYGVTYIDGKLDLATPTPVFD